MSIVTLHCSARPLRCCVFYDAFAIDTRRCRRSALKPAFSGTAMWMKFPSSELQTATDGSGRVSFVMKGLASDRNNAYLVNVAVTNVATGEVATYEVSFPLPPHFLPLRMLSYAFYLVCFCFVIHLNTPPGPHHPERNSCLQSPRSCRSRLRRHHRRLRDHFCAFMRSTFSTGFVLYLPAGSRCYLRVGHTLLLAKED